MYTLNLKSVPLNIAQICLQKWGIHIFKPLAVIHTELVVNTSHYWYKARTTGGSQGLCTKKNPPTYLTLKGPTFSFGELKHLYL